MTLYVFSTSRDQVWLVKAADVDEAEEKLLEQYEDVDRLYYEGTLDQFTSEAELDGLSLINP